MVMTVLAQKKKTAVEEHGQLSIQGQYLVNQKGDIVQLNGMSLFWSQWQPQFYNETTVKNLVKGWGVQVVRAAMAVEHEGYLTHPEREKAKIIQVIEAAVQEGIYVVVDWHDHHAHDHQQAAIQFFSEIAQEYGAYPNVIYETYNEPLQVSWSKVLKPYHEAVIQAIRTYDANNVIVCGTPYWSQRVDEAAMDPIEEDNIAYTLHFYAGTHGQQLRTRAEKAIKQGLPIFVTEFGTTKASGDGGVYPEETKEWWRFMQEHYLSWCNWSIADKAESSAAVLPETTPVQLLSDTVLTTSGRLLRKKLLDQ